MSTFAKEHHPFDKGLGHNTNILLIVILCISSLIVMCKLHIFATTKIHVALAKSDSHCLVSFHRRFNCFFIQLVINGIRKMPTIQ